MKKPGKIAKAAENANLPRIPIKTRGFLSKPGIPRIYVEGRAA